MDRREAIKIMSLTSIGLSLPSVSKSMEPDFDIPSQATFYTFFNPMAHLLELKFKDTGESQLHFGWGNSSFSLRPSGGIIYSVVGTQDSPKLTSNIHSENFGSTLVLEESDSPCLDDLICYLKIIPMSESGEITDFYKKPRSLQNRWTKEAFELMNRQKQD